MNAAHLSASPDFTISKPLMVINGIADVSTPPELTVFADGRPCFSRISRWRSMTENNFSFEFDAVIQLSLGDISESDEVVVEVASRGTTLLRQRLPVSPDLHRSLATISAEMESSRTWLVNQFRCPECFSPRPPRLVGSHYCCCRCDSIFPQTTRALRFLRPSLDTAFSHEMPTQISWHELSPALMSKIDAVRSKGGKILDFGAGFKTRHVAGVISLELIDYPFVDLIASGDRLPIRDNSFDLVLCLSVLEHVQDPFACGREIERVLKPGGELYCIVPFLFPMHAHPHHYYNMTFAGVRNLFSEKMKTSGTRYGHPILSLRHITHEYYNGLPSGSTSRKAFREMTLGELIDRAPGDLEASNFAADLNEKARANLAQGTHTWFRKEA